MNGKYLVHIDFNQIKAEIDNLPSVDNALADKLKCFLDSLKETVEHRFGRIAQKNLTAMKRAYEEIKISN